MPARSELKGCNEARLQAWSRAHAALMLLAAGGAVALEARLAWLCVAAVPSFGALLWLGRRAYTPTESFGAANGVTLLRLSLLCALGFYASSPGPREAMWLLSTFVLDGIDGWLARRHGTSSAFGARFDMEVDAFQILLATLLLYLAGRLGAFILAAGALRYAYVLVVWLWPRQPARPSASEAPPSRIGRYAFALLVVALCASAWPLPHHRPLALAATLLIVWSFARSLRWSFTRRLPVN